MNRGYISVFLNSVKIVMEQLESTKESMDKTAYRKSMDELVAMKKLMEDILNPQSQLNKNQLDNQK